MAEAALENKFRFSRRDLFFSLFSLLLFLLGAETIRQVIRFALDMENSHASQILTVPFVSGWLIWIKRKTIFRGARSSLLPGAMVIALGALLFGLGKAGVFSISNGPVTLSPNDYLSFVTVSLIMLWLGGFLLTYGPMTFRAALFPLLFFFWAVPIPRAILDGIIGILQAGSADVAYVLIKLTGIPVYREGFVFVMPDLVIEVAAACSGIRSAIAIFIATLIAGHLFLRSSRKKIFLLCVAIPILFVKNAIRIAVLIWLAVRWNKEVLTSSLHTDGGVVFFVLGLCMLFPVLALLIKSERYHSTSSAG